MNNTTIATTPDNQTPIKLGITSAALKKLENKYKTVPDATTKEGYQAIVSAKRVLTPLRTGVEAERKLQVAAAVDHQRRVNSVANQIKSRIIAIEQPLYDAKQAVDERAAREKREAEEREQVRIDVIEEKVAGIYESVEGLLGASLDIIQARFAQVNDTDITDAEYQEFVEPAIIALNQVKSQLTSAVNTAKQLADQQAEIDARQKLLDDAERERIKADAERQKAINEAAQAQLEIDNERQRKMDKQQAEIDRQKKEQAQLKYEADLLEEEKAEEERLAIEQEKADKQRIIDDKANAKELKARLPEDIKLQDYIGALQAVKPPELNDPMLCAILREIFISFSDMAKTVFDKTQH